MRALSNLVFWITAFLVLVPVVNPQVRLLDRFRFEDGGYTFVGIFSHHDDHPLQQKIGEFYSDDVSVLNQIKKAWVFREPQRDYACGYHYQILVLKGGSVETSFVVNLECKQLRTEGKSLVFDLKKLESFQSKFKRIKRESRTFESAIEARQYLIAIQSDPGFIYAEPPRWLKYEGEFRFNVKCKGGVKDCYRDEEFAKIAPSLNEAITKAYPGEDFELKPSGGTSNGDLFVVVKCNQSLEEKFDLYDRWNREAFGKFERYHLNLNSYWKALPTTRDEKPIE